MYMARKSKIYQTFYNNTDINAKIMKRTYSRSRSDEPLSDNTFSGNDDDDNNNDIMVNRWTSNRFNDNTIKNNANRISIPSSQLDAGASIELSDLDSSVMQELEERGIIESIPSSPRKRHKTTKNRSKNNNEVVLTQNINDEKICELKREKSTTKELTETISTWISLNAKINQCEDEEQEAKEKERELASSPGRSSLRFEQAAEEAVEEAARETYVQKLLIRKRNGALYQLPPVLFLDDLIEKVEPYIYVAKEIIDRKRGSKYYGDAINVFKNSKRVSLTHEEFTSIDMTKFQAGFYGVKRQLRVGDLIAEELRQDLLRCGSPVVKWWGVVDYSRYVLAPEVLIHLCLEEVFLNKKNIHYAKNKKKDEMDLLDDAYTLFEDTIEFGSIVADTDPLERWEEQSEIDELKRLKLDHEKYGSRCWR
ncbi:hypothetical protein TBLA_0A05680 [Henningerozyma blattae CBS 6284]|uniref:Restriction of telomere capping protein 4 n=1 Tax=Henningerozyma blattae (strain ATCC 34711 / CBS 6284 / DSM 70876 / NBRC 10599 / NRRL Y-10934 / UCD 77-7) TaxID=1071380 RepID=I2GW59_HENB6|nr:hypothetical protein TBLA_0A05680 [Tetrapisispora blattae CBS 6284]CCH58361.1 hypothetical protein TBLA_0A05680 [Tetrapisispora blattae CBS 6284]